MKITLASVEQRSEPILKSSKTLLYKLNDC